MKSKPLLFNCLLIVVLFMGHSTLVDQNYTAYHSQVNQAERHISEGQFEEGLTQYEELVRSYDFVFLRDYKCAAQVAVYLNQKEKAFRFIEQGMTSGWEFKDLEKNKFFDVLREDKAWADLEKRYPDLREKYLQRISEPIREQVKLMFKKDQKKAMGALLRMGDKAQEKYNVNKFAPHSEEQMAELTEILKQYGYPGEKLIGNNWWAAIVISHHNSISKAYNEKDTLYESVRPKLIAALERGEMSPFEYALIDDWYLAVVYDRLEPGYGFLNPVKTSTLTETNMLREAIGLRSIALRNRLVDIEQQTGMNFFLPDWVKGEISIKDQ